MMNANRIALILVAVLTLLALAVPVIGEPQDGIIVEGADVILTPPVNETPPPIDVETRVIAAYANELLRMDLEAMTVPPPVPQRVVAAYANEILREPLEIAPVKFPVPERIVFAYANVNLHFAPAYPLEFIDDTTPPVISDVAAEISSGTTVTITWTTDEFADSEVSCREETGQYPEPESDPSFVKAHELVLTELIPDFTYYYYVCSTDRSGNESCGSEHGFEISTDRYVYLPLILRDSP